MTNLFVMRQCQNTTCQRWFLLKRNTKGMYCCRSCAVQINNTLYQKRKRNIDTICQCGKRKNKEAQRCKKCRTQYEYDLMLSRPITYYISDHPEAKAKFNAIRSWARKTMKRFGPNKECKICSFDLIVEVCHIKPVANFPTTALMSEVNALNNLIYLCPNHHAMLDRGLLKLYAPVD